MSSPDRASEGPTGSVAEVADEEEKSVKVFFTTPDGKQGFYHLTAGTTGRDIVTQDCF